MSLLARLNLFVFCLAYGVTGAHAQTLYKSVGPDGRTIYSDQPPVGAKIEKTLKFDNLPSSPVRPFASAAARPAAKPVKPPEKRNAQEPVLYSAVWCGYCKLAKAWLADNRVSYQEIDIDTPEGRVAYNEAGAGSGVPVLMKDTQYVKGFSAAAYEALLAKR